MLQINDTTYSGNASSFFKTIVFTANDTVEKGLCGIVDGISKATTIPRLDVTGAMFQPRKADPSIATDASGNIEISGSKLTPENMMIFTTIDPRQLEQHFYGEQMTKQYPLIRDRELPKELEAGGMNFEGNVLALYSKKASSIFEKMMWRGRKSYGASTPVDPTTKGDTAEAVDFKYFDGFIVKMLNDTKVQKVASPVALTESNIRQKLKDAWMLVPDALVDRVGANGVKLLLSKKDFKTYTNSLETDSFKNIDVTKTALKEYKDYNIETVAGLPSGTFLFVLANTTDESDLWLGCNSLDDKDKVTFTKAQTYQDSWVLRMDMKVDVVHGVGEQVVLYTTITA